MKKLTSALLALSIIYSCSSNLDDAQDRKSIEFSVSGCRSTSGIDPVSADMTFNLSAHLEDGGPAITDYAWNVKVSQTNGIWKSGIPLFWMNGRDISFYAFSPYQGDGTNESLRLYEADESPAIIYSATESADGHTDILAALDRRASGTVELDFKHITAGIRFVTGKKIQDDVYISDISLDGVYKKATYHLDSDYWEDLACLGESTIHDIGFTMTSGTAAGTPISEQHFFLPPQETLAKISIHITDNGFSDTYTVPVGHIVWEAGKIYTYAISYSGRTLTVSSTESIMEAGEHYIDDRHEIL